MTQQLNPESQELMIDDPYMAADQFLLRHWHWLVEPLLPRITKAATVPIRMATKSSRRPNMTPIRPKCLRGWMLMAMV